MLNEFPAPGFFLSAKICRKQHIEPNVYSALPKLTPSCTFHMFRRRWGVQVKDLEGVGGGPFVTSQRRDCQAVHVQKDMLKKTYYYHHHYYYVGPFLEPLLI